MKSYIKTITVKGTKPVFNKKGYNLISKEEVEKEVEILYFTPENDSDISKLKQIHSSDDSIPGNLGIVFDFVFDILRKGQV